MKKLTLILLIILCLNIIFAGYYWYLKIDNHNNQNISIMPLPDPEPELTTLMFVGDIMLSRGVGTKIKKQGDYRWPFLEIAETLNQADLLFGNLEGPLSDKGQDSGKKYCFRAEPRTIEGLQYVGFDVLSIANNHIFDWGQKAKDDTILQLNQASIMPVGFSEKPVININNTKIGFLAYTFGYNLERVAQEIKELDADIKIISMHIGEEYQKKSSPEQQTLAHLAIDAGADLVIGHHPHVTQEIEEYKNKYIFYSLGNFVFDQQFSEQVKNSWIAKIILQDKKITSQEVINIKINKNYQPELKKQIKINLNKQELCLFKGKKQEKCYVISSGKPGMETPKGNFEISEKIKLHWSAKYEQYLPYSLRFYGPYLIHEIPYNKAGVRDGLDELGKPASHGCIRLGIGDAQEVFEWSETRMEVVVH